MTRQRYFKLILILGSLAALAPFSIDMYLPGFPAIASDLGTSVANVGLSLSGFFVGVSAGQLLYGPLLDRYGRKPPLVLGLVLFVVCSIACANASSIESLIVLRVIQAIGACSASVASVAMVRDLFPVEDNAKVFALLMLVIGTSPMIAPTVGGYVTASLGWHSVFVILAVMGACILTAVLLGLPETRKADPGFSLRPAFIIGNFFSVLRQPEFYTYAFCGALAMAGLLTYVSGSPLLFMEVFTVGEKTYGWIFALLSVGLIGSSNVNSLLLKRYSNEALVKMAFLVQGLISAVLILGTYFNILGLYITIALIFLFLCCAGFILPNTSAMAMRPFANNAGSASSLMGALQMGLGSLATLLLSVFNDHTALPMTLVMGLTSLCGIIVFTIGRKTIVQL